MLKVSRKTSVNVAIGHLLDFIIVYANVHKSHILTDKKCIFLYIQWVEKYSRQTPSVQSKFIRSSFLS